MKQVLLSTCVATLALSACQRDETLAAYGAQGMMWQLVEANGAPVQVPFTLQFGPDGAVSGSAPCNQFAAENSAPYPWFQLTPLAVTRRACPELAQEQALLALMQTMSQSEVLDRVLILRDDDGQEMLFNAGG